MGNTHSINSPEKLQLLQSLTSAIQNICNPLESFGITYFTYSRVFEKKVVFFCNNDEWYQRKFEYDLFDQDGFITVPSLYKNDFTKRLFTGIPDPKIKVLQHMYDLDLWNSIDLYKNEGSFNEVFHFGTTRARNTVLDFFVNNLHLLECFAYYFREHLMSLIGSKTDLYELDLTAISDIAILEDIRSRTFNQEFNCSHNFTFFLNGQYISFSPRQRQCLALLYRGKTAKEIGRVLSLSHRTVEYYLDHIKMKLGCHTRNELIELLASHKAERSMFIELSDEEIIRMT